MKTARPVLLLLVSGFFFLIGLQPVQPQTPLVSRNGIQLNEITGAVVKIPSHGGSGQVIATNPSWSLILSCGHMFAKQGSLGRLIPNPEALRKKITLEAPWPSPKEPKPLRIELLAVDFKRDLSLIVAYFGNAPYVLQVAPPGHRPSGQTLSAGYDNLQPITIAKVTIVKIGQRDGEETNTQEPPWHGRSGGALIDQAHGVLIGVVQGYYGPYPHGKGIYVAHVTILAFLTENQAFINATPDRGLPPSVIGKFLQRGTAPRPITIPGPGPSCPT